ncbi:hypothetical protein KAJ83_13750 [Marivibrio halodurans]|uniref:Uncharacterized protein n=1 Tax=Marivibrio halodurans TaxID=2039722 RepID=A0A8J7SNL3_9PROT|nr:hypothetical protein [Marivibrio halodurans]MBP5858078.1 hypothetical protein [Marivibrio halodurans]
MADGEQQSGVSALPETFQQRGIAAPFTTRVLSFARYRRAHGAADVLVPGLGGGTAVYVIPFKALPSVFSMTVYDRAVHEQLTAIHVVTPLTMRKVALQVAETGLGGPRPMRRARQWRDEQEALRNKILFELIKSAVAQLGGKDAAAHAMDERTMMTPEGLSAARNALKGFASQAQVSAGEIIQRLEIWADLTVVIGPPSGAPMKGPLTAMIEQIEALAEALAQWLGPEPPDTAEMAQRTAMAARMVAKEARAVLDRLVGSANAMSEPLQGWDKARVQINRRVERISYLLDGWQRILDMWDAAQRADRHQQRDVLETFAQHIPILPVEAVGADTGWIELRRSQARWVKTSRNRLDSEIDDTVREKLGNFRTEAV